MGALTNKNYPFELRSWEIKKLKIIDFMDCFGSSVKALIHKNKILQIEPDHSFANFKNIFINDKTRYFFDNLLNAKMKLSFKVFNKILKTLIKTLYLFELNFLRIKQINFFLIIYQNLSLDLLCFLSFFDKHFCFIKLINVSKEKKPNNLEHQLLFNKTNFDNSKLCVFINIEPKYENTLLYLILNQRKLKGNLKLILLGSLSESLIYFNYLGTTTKIITKLTEGLHPLCQTLKYNLNFLLIINSQMLKFAKNNFMFLLLNVLHSFVVFYNLNFLSISIYQTGVNLFSKSIRFNNLIHYQFSSFYFIGVRDKSFFDNFFQNNLLYLNKLLLFLKLKKNFIIQNNLYFNKNKFNNQNVFYLPTKNIFEESSMFLNTEGLVKNSKPIFFASKSYSNWKFLRCLFFKLKNVYIIYKTEKLINYKIKNKFFFYKYIYLFYLAKTIKLNEFELNKISQYKLTNSLMLNLKRIFINNSKIKFWLNDFFYDTKNYQNSTIMIKFSKLHRLQKTNFF